MANILFDNFFHKVLGGMGLIGFPPPQVGVGFHNRKYPIFFAFLLFSLAVPSLIFHHYPSLNHIQL